MQVAAHPHTGLQTASWLFSGEVEHCDSLGSMQHICPGQLNLMTAGSGIAHSELALASSPEFHGVQLWIALPDETRNQQSHFDHYADLPKLDLNESSAIVFIGELFDSLSPAITYSQLVGAEINLAGKLSIPLNDGFEYGVLVVNGTVQIDGKEVLPGSLHYQSQGASSMEFQGEAKLIFLGGTPFDEKILMWWNFIGRTHEEIEVMREQWNQRLNGFNDFPDNVGGCIPAPEMPKVRLAARNNKN